MNDAIQPLGNDTSPADPPDSLSPDAKALRIAAQAAGVETDIIVGKRYAERETWLRLHIEGRRFLYTRGILLHATDDPDQPFGRHVNGIEAGRTANKHRTKAILTDIGIAVPEGRLFDREAEVDAIAYAAALDGTVCIKPNRGFAGQYVYLGLSTPLEWGAAFRKAQRLRGGVLVERGVPGEVLRLYYVAPDYVAVKLNRTPGVTGDGRSTVAELVDQRNSLLSRPGMDSHVPIRRDADMHRALTAQGLTYDAVPEAGQLVRLGYISNISRGADSIDGRDGTHPSYIALAVQACRAFPRLQVGAVDMMVTERDQPAAPGNHWVIEINSSPGISDFLYPWSGAPQDVGAKIIALLQGMSRQST